MAIRFSAEDWLQIRPEFDASAHAYGLPERRHGSVLLASFNIRELSAEGGRLVREWEFLADCLRPFDLISIQEVGADLSGLRKLMSLLGDAFALVISDVTGEHPGIQGNPERLAFLYRTDVVQRKELASDITYDRTMVINLLADNLPAFNAALQDYAAQRAAWNQGQGPRPDLVKVNLPAFLTFIRQPFCVAFEIPGLPGSEPLSFVAINAHLYFGTGAKEARRQEIGALINWIRASLQHSKYLYAKNFILLGDLNFIFDRPIKDREAADDFLKAYNVAAGALGKVNFPFLDKHRSVAGLLHSKAYFRSNARQDQTYDQIGMFGPDDWVWSYDQNELLPTQDVGPDFGMFNFQELFARSLFQRPFRELTAAEKKSIWDRSQHKISDHMPIWIRLPLPT